MKAFVIGIVVIMACICGYASPAVIWEDSVEGWGGWWYSPLNGEYVGEFWLRTSWNEVSGWGYEFGMRIDVTNEDGWDKVTLTGYVGSIGDSYRFVQMDAGELINKDSGQKMHM